MNHGLTYSLLGVIGLLTLVLVALWRVSLRRIVELRLALEDAAPAAGAVEELAAEARRQARRADELFAIIEGVEKERDGWQRLYRESSQAAGVAQSWLARDLSRVVQVANILAERLRAKGEKVPAIGVDPQLTQVVEEFAEMHGNPRPEVTGTSAMALAKAVQEAPSGESQTG